MSRHDKALRDRWTTETTDSALDFLLRGRPESPFGTHEGRVDLRGLSVDQPARVPVNESLQRITKLFTFERRAIRNVDLSGSILPEWRIVDTTFENCVFDHSKLVSLRAYSAHFQRCQFTSAVLKDAVLGAASGDRKPGGVFEECDFSAADLRGVSTDPGRFSHCNFRETKWKGTRFLNTVLEYCDFRDATVDGAFFDGRAFAKSSPVGLGENKLAGCDFSTTTLIDTSFLAIDFRNCSPPSGPDFILIDQYPRMVEDALSYLRATPGPDASIAATILGAESQSAKFLPRDAVGLLQLNHYPGGSRALVSNAFGVQSSRHE